MKDAEVVNQRISVSDVPEHLRAGRPVRMTDVDGWCAAGNYWHSVQALADAMGTDTGTLIKVMVEAIRRPVKCSTVEPDLRDAGEVNLMKLPFPRYFPTDGGRYITGGLVFAEHDGKRNVSYHRMMLTDERHAVIRLVSRHLHTMWKAAGEDLRVAVVFTDRPEIMLCAAMSVDYGTFELEIANSMASLAGREPVRCADLDGITIPEDCGAVMTARITSETAEEGPFVDLTGTIDGVREQPVVEFDRLYHRGDPFFYLIYPGGREHRTLMGMPRVPVIWEAVERAVPGVRGVHLTEGGCGWLHCVVSIDKVREGDAKNAGMAALAAHTSLKMVTVVDSDIDVYSPEEVEWALATRFQAHRDIVVVPEATGSSLDPSSSGTTSKLILDATAPVSDRERFRKVADSL